MYPDDYLGSYEIMEESNGKAKIKCKIEPGRCKCCDQDSARRNGPKTKTVYDIDQRTGNIIEIEVIHYQYRCKHPDCKSTFIFDALPTRCFPHEEKEGRQKKSASRDVLNAAMDYFLLGKDDNGNPVTIDEAAQKFGYDRKVIATELHARVNTVFEEHILSNETCAQAAIVPFVYRGIMRCAVMGYNQKDGEDSLRPVLYDIRDSYNHEDLEKYLKEYRYQGIIVPEVTYLDMDESIIELVYKLYMEDYQSPYESFFTGIIKDIVRKKINATEAPDLPKDFCLRDSFRYYKRKLEANLYDKELCEDDDDNDDVWVDADLVDKSFYEILDDWMEEVQPPIIAKKLKPLYDFLYEYADSIDISMMRYREDGVCPEDELAFVQHFHKSNVDFEEMRYRVHCLSKNKQNVSFQSLITGQYKPTERKTLRRYYIDLKELNELFKD